MQTVLHASRSARHACELPSRVAVHCTMECQQSLQRSSGFVQRLLVATALITAPALPVCAEHASLQARLSDINPLHDWLLSAN